MTNVDAVGPGRGLAREVGGGRRCRDRVVERNRRARAGGLPDNAYAGVVRQSRYVCGVANALRPSLPIPMQAPPWERIDGLARQYRFERELGRGGMATVYLAHDIAHDRPVAIKVMRRGTPTNGSMGAPIRRKRRRPIRCDRQQTSTSGPMDRQSVSRPWRYRPLVHREPQPNANARTVKGAIDRARYSNPTGGCIECVPPTLAPRPI